MSTTVMKKAQTNVSMKGTKHTALIKKTSLKFDSPHRPRQRHRREYIELDIVCFTGKTTPDTNDNVQLNTVSTQENVKYCTTKYQRQFHYQNWTLKLLGGSVSVFGETLSFAHRTPLSWYATRD